MKSKDDKKKPTVTKGKLSIYLRKAYIRFIKIRGEPRAIALGFALGLLVGFTPFLGLHTAIAVFLAALLKWNKLSAALSVWIINPVSAPFIYGMNYLIGQKILGIRKAAALPDEFGLSVIEKILNKGPEILWALTIGGIVTGLPLAFLGYFVSLFFIRRYNERIRKRLVRRKEILAKKMRQIKEAGKKGTDFDGSQE